MQFSLRCIKTGALALSLGLSVLPAWAGSVSIAVKPGEKAETTVVIKAAAGGGSATLTTKDNGIGDRDPRVGHITVEPGIDQDEISSSTIKAVGPAASAVGAAASAATSSHMVFGDAGLASFEPIDLPRLLSTDGTRILLSVINVSDYLALTAPPMPGDSLDVLGGLVAGIDGLTLYDATDLYGGVDSFFDVFFELDQVNLNLLPRWQGQIWVDSMIEFRQLVPEPGAMLLPLAAGLALALQRRRQRPDAR